MTTTSPILNFTKNFYFEIGYNGSENKYYAVTYEDKVEYTQEDELKPLLIGWLSFKGELVSIEHEAPVLKATIEFKSANFTKTELSNTSDLVWVTKEKETIEDFKKISSYVFHLVGNYLDQPLDSVVETSGIDCRLNFVDRVGLFNYVLGEYLKIISKPIGEAVSSCFPSKDKTKVIH